MDILELECELCHKLTSSMEMAEGLCRECQIYLEPTFLRKQVAPKLYLIKGGKNERDY